MTENPWKTKSSKIVYETPWMKVWEDEVIHPDGKEGKYSFVETPDSVFVVPIDSDGKTYLIGLHRYPTKNYSWELPGGSTDGKNVLESAKNELKEETGLEAEEWLEVGKQNPMNGVVSEVEHVFIAQGLRQTTENKEAAEGINRVKRVSFDEFEDMVGKGEIIDAQTIAAFTQAKIYLKSSK